MCRAVSCERSTASGSTARIEFAQGADALVGVCGASDAVLSAVLDIFATASLTICPRFDTLLSENQTQDISFNTYQTYGL
jgi:hypothetical protein